MTLRRRLISPGWFMGPNATNVPIIPGPTGPDPVFPIGFNVYVNTNSITDPSLPGAGTTTATSGPNGAYRKLGLAVPWEAYKRQFWPSGIVGDTSHGFANGIFNLAGTGGITFWCQGGREIRDTAGTQDNSGGIFTGFGTNDTGTDYKIQPSGPNAGQPYPPLCYSRPIFFNQTTGPDNRQVSYRNATISDPIRLFGHPTAPDGRNYGPTIDFNKYHLANLGQGVEGEVSGGTVLYTQNTGYLIIDGLQFYMNGDFYGNGADDPWTIEFPQGTGTAIVRNCYFMLDSSLVALGQSGIVWKGSAGSVGLVENCSFVQGTAGVGEQAIVIGGDTTNATLTVRNCTINGWAAGVYCNTPATGANVQVINTAIFNGKVTHSGVVHNFQNVNAANTFTVDHCITDQLQSTMPNITSTNARQFVGGATAWNANFVNYSIGDDRVLNNLAQIYGTGVVTATNTDIIGVTRKTPPDIGAWELLP